jgi:hypothetical protein
MRSLRACSPSVLNILVAVLGSTALQADVLWRDNFREAQTYERWGPRSWTLADGEMRFSAGATAARLIPRLPDLGETVARARVSVGERLGTSYVFAGLVLFADESNHWQLLLVESPEGKRYMELIENLDGVHQAQGPSGTSATRLPMEDSGDLSTWERGREYQLELALSPKAIVGTVTDPATGTFWRRTYGLDTGRAVKRGRPGLTTLGLAGAFREFEVEGPAPKEATPWKVPAGKAGTVAIIADEHGGLGESWQRALADEGYGVLLLKWDDLLTAPPPASGIDLLVLADARRLPVQARDAVKQALRASGKVIALGAPAFMEVLAHTPQGWVGPDEYSQALVSELKPVPVSIAPDSWRRNARYPEKHSTIEPAPEEGEGAWKLAFDYDGWDGFQTDIAGAFGEDRTLLTFRARGDADTPQLLVECRETDGSRWIGAVPLTTEWRAYALRPQDLPYWRDSPGNRGAPGDHFRPANAASVVFGIAQSHTPKVQPGLHTLWLKDIGTAADPGGADVDFSIPEIEALSPSYQLFPLRTPARLQVAREQGILAEGPAMTLAGAAYSPVWRERGRGFDRERSWRWIPLLEVRDKDGRHRGAPVSLMIGDGASPDAMWANVAVADPQAALDSDGLKRTVLRTARAMVRGCFLLEAGAPVFSCEPGGTLTFGAEVLNAGKQAQDLTVLLDGPVVAWMGGAGITQQVAHLNVKAGRRAIVTWPLKVPVPSHSKISVGLTIDGRIIDTITHELAVEPREPAKPDDFVRVEGDGFVLHGKPWYFKGINYRPTWIGGHPHLNFLAPECYDPEIIERDLSWMESVGINAISAVHALVPTDQDAPGAYRDQLDFLDRCERHGIKVFFFLPNARPFAGADPEWVKQYIARAGIKDHPAIMCWELSWEPIHGPWNHGLDFMLDPWNRWVIERYGSVENALVDWGYKPQLTADGKLPVPTTEMVTQHGEWDVMVAAFRRAWSDVMSQAYRAIVEPLRAFDPQHLISFRFGACSIPDGQRFAHAHSVGVMKHVDFMNPEGYSLMTSWTTPTPADDWRKGGVITLYFRHFSGEKPVVWMEFGYTVNGIHDPWTQERVHIKPEQLAEQKAEYEALYSMFIESGARGAAPWWLPGGFRLGENSDFGVLEPDGSERPVCEVLHKYLPQFERVRHDPPTATIDLDLDAHYADAWKTYSEEYLRLVKAGERPAVQTAGTGTTSADCPFTAVGDRPYNGHNPPIYLNAEFNSLEVRSGDGPWQSVEDGGTLEVTAGQPVTCRASVGNLGEAKWLAPKGDESGGVLLAGRKEYGLEFEAPTAADTPFLGDANVPEFVLIEKPEGEVTVSFEMTARGRAYFGERRTVRLKTAG